MDADEKDICIYLKSWAGQFVSAREIGRRAGGKRRFQEDPNWCAPVLGRLVEKGIIEDDSLGHYRLVKKEKKDQPKKWVSPQMKKILEKSGKDFGTVTNLDVPEDFFDE